jgi:hypothetical protein
MSQQVYPEVLMKPRNEDGRFLGRDSNPVPAECELRIVTVTERRLVNVLSKWRDSEVRWVSFRY